MNTNHTTPIDDGGPAFGRGIHATHETDHGMSLRAHIATTMLPAIYAKCVTPAMSEHTLSQIREMTSLAAVRWADALIAELKKS